MGIDYEIICDAKKARFDLSRRNGIANVLDEAFWEAVGGGGIRPKCRLKDMFPTEEALVKAIANFWDEEGREVEDHARKKFLEHVAGEAARRRWPEIARRIFAWCGDHMIEIVNDGMSDDRLDSYDGYPITGGVDRE